MSQSRFQSSGNFKQSSALQQVAEVVTNDSAEDSEDDLSSLLAPNVAVTLSPAEEFQRAKVLYTNARKLMQDIMTDVRQQKKIDLKRCESNIKGIVESVTRFPSALLPMLQMKTRNEYPLQHSVAVAALAVAFGRIMNLSESEILQTALAGYLQDIGKALISARILDKQGKLNDEEFELMKGHVAHSIRLLEDIPDIGPITLNAVAQHHERYDGTGYPKRLKGDQISRYGQMLAILDTYDAITSISTYRKGSTPTETLKKLFEWSGTHFDPTLVQFFIKGIGIYPAGSLVRLASGKLGIVRDLSNEKLLRPTVQIIYDCKKMDYISPATVDLSTSKDKIISHESFSKWGMDPSRWTTVFR